jgi:hypothetical protein
MGVGWLLSLGPLEELYFESDSARAAIIFQDRLGLTVGIFLHLFGVLVSRRRAAVALCCSTALLLLAQLAWLNNSTASYLRHRHRLALAHRARIILVVAGFSAFASSAAVYPFHRAAQFPGSLRALVHVVVFPAAYNLAPVVNHGLPFRSELLLAPLRLLIALQGVPHQAAALRQAELGEWVQPACNALRGAILAPALLQSEEAGNFCTELGPPFLLVLVHVLLGAVLPLQVGRGRAWGWGWRCGGLGAGCWVQAGAPGPRGAPRCARCWRSGAASARRHSPAAESARPAAPPAAPPASRQVLFWRERSAKRQFLRQLLLVEAHEQAAQGQEQRLVPCLAYAWAWCLLAWYATGLGCRALAPRALQGEAP